MSMFDNLPKPLYLLLLILITGCDKTDVTEDNRQNITPQFSSARFTVGEVDVKQVLRGEADKHFITPPEKTFFGNAEITYWYKTRLSAAVLNNKKYMLEIPYPLLDKVDIWFRTGGERIIHYQAGSLYPYALRVINDPNMVFPLPDNNGQDVDVVVTVNTSSLLPFSVLLVEENTWLETQLQSRMWYGVFFGGIAILIIYNLFLSVALRDASYIYYIFYLFGLALINAMVSGHSEMLLWLEPGKIDSRIVLLVAALTIISALQFVNHFLNVRANFPRLWKTSVAIMVLIIPPAIPELFSLNLGVVNGILIAFILVLGNLGILYYLAVVVASYRIGIKQARFVIFAFSTFFIGFYFYQTFLFQGAEPNFIILHMLEAGTLAEGLLLSLALADRINLLAQQKQTAEKQTLHYQRSFAKKLIRAQEMDRERFSSSLHDSIGHGILVLKQKLENFANGHFMNKSSNTQNISNEINQQAEYCGQILAEVRHMSQDLHPHILTRLGLKSAIQETMERALTTQNIQYQVDIDNTPFTIEAEREITLYRVIQECLNNILKHAQAAEVILSLTVKHKKIQVNIKDDGKGFITDSMDPTGLGINTMKGRLELFGGGLTINSTPGTGTHLIISIPIA